jgi:hypothetical protein
MASTMRISSSSNSSPYITLSTNFSDEPIICLLFFQLVVSFIGAATLTGHFVMAISIAVTFALALAIVAAFVKGL